VIASLLARGDDEVFGLAAQYNAVKKNVTLLETKKRKVLAEIYSIEKETNKLVLEKTDLSEEKLQLDERLSTISQKIVGLERRAQSLVPELIDRLKFSNRISDLPWLYTIITAQTLGELDSTFETARHINKQQSAKIGEFVGLLKELRLRKAELNRTALGIVKLQKQLKTQEAKIETNQKNKKQLLSDLEAQIRSTQNNLQRIKGRGQQALKNSVFKDLDLLFGSQFFDQKGQLPPPINAPLFHGYGLNKGLLPNRIQLMHKGFFYRTLTDPQPVHAVSAGRVRYAGYAKGYGQVVILDHGSHYYTTYANLGETTLKTGDEVKTKQELGLTGHDHLQFGQGLYFEIRHFSQPQNPESWLKKSSKQLANLQ
jgi:septal ring factor EnvC (AmiA/AmiB activator)